ncbi:MAG: hypothetical protein ACREGR_01840 [Minisyncoccia bacterium]
MSDTKTFTAEVCQLGVPNKNGRVYTKDCFKGVLGKQIIGHLDSPETWVKTQLSTASHAAILREQDDKIMADVETLVTPSGKILKALLDDGVKIAFRPRGTGKLEPEGDHVVVKDYELFSVDALHDNDRDAIKDGGKPSDTPPPAFHMQHTQMPAVNKEMKDMLIACLGDMFARQKKGN